MKTKWQEEPTTKGEISISGLSVGEHHFVCAVNGHCQAGMRFTVTVTPSDVEHANSEQVRLLHIYLALSSLCLCLFAGCYHTHNSMACSKLRRSHCC